MSALVRVIAIQIDDGGMCEVIEGARSTGPLSWDEMLGTIAELTHPKLGTCRLSMLTAEQWAYQKLLRERRIKEIFEP